MKIRTTLDWESLRFQLSSFGFTKQHLSLIKEILELHKKELGAKKPTEEEIYEFCKDHYYCDAIAGEQRSPWEPFENYSDEAIEKFIDNDVWALTKFLNNQYKK